MALHEIDETRFATEIQGEQPVLVEFSAAWCAPCRVLLPHLRAVAEANAGRLRVATCDVDENPHLAAEYEVRSVPTLMLFQRGQVLGQIVGAVPRARIDDLVRKAAPVEQHAAP